MTMIFVSHSLISVMGFAYFCQSLMGSIGLGLY
jgi:hypothetical protein